MKLGYFTIGRSSVFDSQVLTLLKKIREKGYFNKVVLFFAYRDGDDLIWLQERDLSRIDIVVFKIFPNYPIFNILNKLILLNVIRKNVKDKSKFVMHTRGELIAFYMSYALENKLMDIDKIVVDIRGVSLEETIEFSSKMFLLKNLKQKNKMKLRESLVKYTKISVVSTYLKEYLVNQGGVKNDSIKINPCIVNDIFVFNQDMRIKVRSNLQIGEDEIVVIFSTGGGDNWQNTQTIIHLANVGFRVINLSKTVFTHPKIINKFVKYQDVPHYLCAADVGFIWRNESIVNLVASPVKFTEYLSCGLPVVSNGNVGQINDIVLRYGVGLIEPDITNVTIDKISLLVKSTDRVKTSLLGRSFFSSDIAADNYISTYFS